MGLLRPVAVRHYARSHRSYFGLTPVSNCARIPTEVRSVSTWELTVVVVLVAVDNDVSVKILVSEATSVDTVISVTVCATSDAVASR